MSVRKYELMVILDPARGEDQQKEILQKIEEVIKRYEGEPAERDIWGKRRLAYQLSRRREGYYAVLYFNAESAGPCLKEVELHCKFSDDILRHMLTSAVTNKSKGNPALAAQVMERQQQPVGPPPRGTGARPNPHSQAVMQGQFTPSRTDLEGAPSPAAAPSPAPAPAVPQTPEPAEAKPEQE